MSTRTKQAFNDGRVAYREGREIGESSRRSPQQRAAFREGYEYEQKLDLRRETTPEQRAEARKVVSDLKKWALTHLAP